MPRAPTRRSLAVWMNGERVGTWSTRPGRPDEFSYAPEWLRSASTRPLSLSMPLRPTGFAGEVVAAYFDNLLPDSRSLRERIHRRFGTRTQSPFDLLTQIGRDCVGAVQLLPEGETRDVRTIVGAPLTPKRIEALLLDQVTGGTTYANENEDFRISLAGAQEKTALLRHGGKWLLPKDATPSTHILKLPMGTGGGGIDLSTSVENEWLCSRILNAYGIPVANCWMERFGAQKVLVVERFDRALARDRSWIVRLPQEDLCQAYGLPPDRKYEADGGPGIRRIMDLLLGSTLADDDRRDFLKTQILFWMLCAIDGHAKNFSVFLEAGGGYRLTPRYDVLSAFPVLGNARGRLAPKKVKMAMAAEGANRHYRWHTILPRHWEETARRCGMQAQYASIRDELMDRTAGAIESVSAELPKGFPNLVVEPIVAGLRRTRAALGDA